MTTLIAASTGRFRTGKFQNGKFQALLIFLSKIFLSVLPLHAQTPGISYTLPRAGKVSLAVYDAHGRQLRTLLAGEWLAAGKHEVNWDGLDRLGNAMAVGSYEWRLLLNAGLEADYLAVVGQSLINPAEPWVRRVLVFTPAKNCRPCASAIGSSTCRTSNSL